MEQQQKYRNLKKGERGAIISIIVYICLSVLKLAVGFLSGSDALRADGLNNTTDIVSSMAILIGLKISQRPADDNHPYGHWKSETIASLIASFIMMMVGLEVLFGGVESLFQGEKDEPDLIAARTGLFSAVIMFLVYKYNYRLAERIHSHSVMAAAKDNLSDALVSIGTAIGIFSSQFGLPWLDILTAMVVGLMICKTAWGIFWEASYQLSDGFDEDKLEEYKETVEHLQGVEAVKEVRARSYGSNAIVDVVILVNSQLDICDAHNIANVVENTLIGKFHVHDVHVHVEPWS